MPTPPTIALEPLLAPISDKSPVGVDLAFELDYDQIREARRIEEGVDQGDWQRKAKPADWEKVISLGTACLSKKTKDLQIASWMTEALGRRKGFAGLRDGFKLLLGIQDAYWKTYYPVIEDDDPETRYGPFLFLDRTIPLLIRSIAITEAPGPARYSYLDWKKSRTVTRPKTDSDDESKDAEPLFTADVFDEAFNRTKRKFLELLAEDLHECFDAFLAFDQSTDAEEHFGRDTPGLTEIRKAFDDVVTLVDRLLSQKRELEPWETDTPVATDSVEDPETNDSDERTTDDSDVSDESASEEDPESETITSREDANRGRQSDAPKPPKQARQPVRGKGGPIVDAEDARARIVEASAFLRKAEASDPAGYLVSRALRMAGLFAIESAQNLASEERPCPESEDRKGLRKLAAEGAAEPLLDRAEEILSRPEALAWLDPHRHAITAMESAGLTAPAAAARAWVRLVLGRFPELAEAELFDGTTAADSDTRHWVEAENLAAGSAGSNGKADSNAFSTFEPVHEPESDPDSDFELEPDSERPADPWDQAVALNRSGRPAEAIELIRHARSRADSGRERFLRTLQLAELFAQAGQTRVALHLAEELDRQIDEHRLESWEPADRLARAWTVLCQCLKALGPEPGAAERWRAIYARLCRIDVSRALDVGASGPPA